VPGNDKVNRLPDRAVITGGQPPLRGGKGVTTMAKKTKKDKKDKKGKKGKKGKK
jgi:hypothetical protein